MSDQEEVRLPLNPATATLVQMEAEGNANVFALGVAFPRDSLGDGPQLTVSFPVAAGKILDPAICKDIAKELATELQRRGRLELVTWTRWPSVAAAIQKIIIDFNSKRGTGGDTPLVIQ